MIFGDKRVVTIADVEERLFSLWHALYRQSAFITPSTERDSNLRRINPKLVFPHSLIYVVEPVASSDSVDLERQATFSPQYVSLNPGLNQIMDGVEHI